MKIKGIKRFEKLKNIHEKYMIYCDVKKSIIVENLSEENAGGPYCYGPDGKLTDFLEYAKIDQSEKLLIEYVSYDSLVTGDFFICDCDVYCLIRWKGKTASQICGRDKRVKKFRNDTLVARIMIASAVPDSIFDKVYNFIEKMFR